MRIKIDLYRIGHCFCFGFTRIINRLRYLVATNDAPFEKGYEREVNHIGDIDVYNNEVYCGVELFKDGAASNIQIAVYDGDTLELKRTFNFEEYRESPIATVPTS